jgi:hypothetical protein
MFRIYRLKTFSRTWQTSIETGTHPIGEWQVRIEEPELWDVIMDKQEGPRTDEMVYVFAWTEELDSLRILIADAELERHGFMPTTHEY